MAEQDWLAGLVDGEGSFSLQARRRSVPGVKGRTRHIAFTLRVGLRADDLDCLKEARRIAGTGRIVGPIGNRLERRPMYCWYVNTREGIARIIETFRAHPLRSKKRRDFETWAEAFEYFVGTVEKRFSRRTEFRGQPRQHKRIPHHVFSRVAGYKRRLEQGREYDPSFENVDLENGPSPKERIEARLKLKLLCACGCGTRLKITKLHSACRLTRYVSGSHARKAKSESNFKEWFASVSGRLCACGCEQKVNFTRYHFRHQDRLPIFLHGHHRRKRSAA